MSENTNDDGFSTAAEGGFSSVNNDNDGSNTLGVVDENRSPLRQWICTRFCLDSRRLSERSFCALAVTLT